MWLFVILLEFFNAVNFFMLLVIILCAILSSIFFLFLKHAQIYKWCTDVSLDEPKNCVCLFLTIRFYYMQLWWIKANDSSENRCPGKGFAWAAWALWRWLQLNENWWPFDYFFKNNVIRRKCRMFVSNLIQAIASGQNKCPNQIVLHWYCY